MAKTNYYKKKKETILISTFDKHKKLYELKKNRSPLTILLCTEDLPDKWLIDVVEYKTKSGVVTDNYYITAKDVERYMKLLARNGHDKLTKF
jgi:hypothetical protein